MLEQLSRKEKKTLHREQKMEEHRWNDRRRFIKRIARNAILILAILGGAAGLSWYITKKPIDPNDITKQCVQHGAVEMHIHPVLSITIKSQPVLIPANVGIPSSYCMRPIHTHDDSGTLHLEFPVPRPVKLGEFFKIWRKEFNSNCIFEYCNGLEGKVKMLVNGQPNTEFENYVMKDRDKIEIIYE